MSYNKKEENKVIDIINSKIDLPDLKYENVRSKINESVIKEEVFVEEKPSIKEKFFFKKGFAIQFACALICVMIVCLVFIGDMAGGFSSITSTGTPEWNGGFGEDSSNDNKIDIKDYLGSNVLVKDEDIYVFEDFDIKLESVKPSVGGVAGSFESVNIVAILPKETTKLNLRTEIFLELVNTNKINFVNGGSLDELGDYVNISFKYSDENVDGFMLIESNGKTYNTTYIFNYADIINEYYKVCFDLKLSIVAKNIKLTYNESGFVFTIENISGREIIIYENDVR